MTGFLRLWLVLAITFAVVDLSFNLLYFGWVDLRPEVFWRLLLLPLAQALVVTAIARRGPR